MDNEIKELQKRISLLEVHAQKVEAILEGFNYSMQEQSNRVIYCQCGQDPLTAQSCINPNCEHGLSN